MATGKRSSARAIQKLERQKKVIELRRARLTYREIGAALGVSAMTARNDIADWTENYISLTEEEADRLRAEELDTLDKLQRAIYKEAIGGNLAAVDKVIKLVEARSKLLGLNAPTKTTIASEDNGEGVGLAVLLNRIEEREAIEPPTE